MVLARFLFCRVNSETVKINLAISGHAYWNKGNGKPPTRESEDLDAVVLNGNCWDNDSAAVHVCIRIDAQVQNR
jgi:hypothetical protein